MGFRLFIFESDGVMRHIPQRIANYLPTGSKTLPEYASQRLRYAAVFLATQGRKPIEITRIESGYFSFDDRGNPRSDLARDAIRLWDVSDRVRTEEAQKGPVTSVVARLERKALDRETRWTPNDSEIRMIRAAVWPKT